MAPDDEVDEHFARALELHGMTRQPFETARTQLRMVLIGALNWESRP